MLDSRMHRYYVIVQPSWWDRNMLSVVNHYAEATKEGEAKSNKGKMKARMQASIQSVPTRTHRAHVKQTQISKLL